MKVIELMKNAPYSKEYESHCNELNFYPESLKALVYEVNYCISKYTEDGFENYIALNEDNSWMPHKHQKEYESHKNELKKELKELKKLSNYIQLKTKIKAV